MLGKIEFLIENNKSEVQFFSLIGRHFPKGGSTYKLIQKAYRDTMDAFQGIKRDGGTPYFGHPEAVTLIVHEHLRTKDPNVIAASLLHDNIEDLAGWTVERIALEYNQHIAELVWWVTKSPVEQYGGSKDSRDRDYHRRLRNAPREAIIIKLADRLHNIMTLWDTDLQKRRRKIQETRDFYIPLAEDHIVLIQQRIMLSE